MIEVALALPPGPAAAWIDEVAGALRDSPATALAGVVESTETPGGALGLWPRLYAALDRRLFDLGADDALRPGEGITDSLPRLEPGPAGLDSVDLLVDLTLAGAPGPQQDGPRPHATWTVHLGDAGGADSLAKAFASAAPCYSASLWVRTAGEAEPALAEISVGRLDEISLHRNLSRGCWRAAALVQRRLAALGRGDGPGDREPLEHLEGSEAPQRGGRFRPRRAPSPPAVVARMARRRAQTRFLHDCWKIRLRRATAGPPQPAAAGEDVRELIPPPGRFYADPFLVEAEGRFHLLFEEYISAEQRGTISAATLDADGWPGPVRRALDAPHHLSYPFAFEHGGEHFMVPESAAAGTVELYRATRLPDRWQHAGTLLTGLTAYDPTLLEHAGRFWLWVATAPRAGVDADELRLFSSPDLLGPYSPHPLNPVLTDVRRARPAGGILSLDGELLRPTQDGAEGYGGRVRWRRIEHLDPDDYRETDAGFLEPPPQGGFSGLHTFNRFRGWEAFDLLERRRRHQHRRVLDRIGAVS